MSPVRRPAALLILTCAAITVLSSARAQEFASPTVRSNGNDASDVPPLVVTAQKLAQDPQQVPVSLDVLTGQGLDDAVELKDFERLAESLPNVRYTDTGGRATFGYLQIRGLINSAQAVDPAVAVYVDGVPVGDFYSFSQRLYDVDRVEVLRGPQSTLYGANSEAGVINIYSRLPDAESRAELSASYGSFDSYDTTAIVSGPLVKGRLYFSLAGTVDGRDGFLHNVVTGHQYDDEFSYAGRARLRWTPTDALEVMLTLSGQRIDDGGGFLYLPTERGAYNRVLAAQGLHVGPFENAIDFEGQNTAGRNLEALQATWHAPWFDLVSVTARRENKQFYDYDADLTPSPYFTAATPFYSSEWNEEIRLQSAPGPVEPALNWVAGFAFDRLERDTDTLLTAEPGNPFYVPAGTYTFGRGDLLGLSEGVFGQATWRPFADRRFGMTAGIRYDNTQRELDRRASTFSPFPGLDAQRDDRTWLPKFALDYRIDPHKYLYVSAAKGWITGGLNPAAPTVALSSYRKQTSWTYELGVKTDWWGDGLRVNASAFYNEISNYQDVVYIDPINGYLANAAKAYTRGLELEIVARPVRGLEITGTLGYVDAFYDDYLYSVADDLRLDGRRIPQVPDYDFSVAAEYRYSLGWSRTGSTAFLRGEVVGNGTFVSYQSQAGGATPTISQFVAPGYHVFNLKAGFEAERWSIYGYVTNLADTQYFTRYELGFGALSAYDGPVGVEGDRRVTGVGGSVRF